MRIMSLYVYTYLCMYTVALQCFPQKTNIQAGFETGSSVPQGEDHCTPRRQGIEV
jgi:hypothetical protein